ncbi:UNVERIFIED_ORG: hypothetical protein DFS12_10490 [Chitinophaga ginsengisegetis]|nr:hypothetical protein [Chitinophaga ginsengisegetis]MDR6648029.1 hypothetical protein [Chitinophaga ginsengisegetis]MDR6654821.1 hypothetical protein [Chitinophaga ginsengisegetis]
MVKGLSNKVYKLTVMIMESKDVCICYGILGSDCLFFRKALR